MPPVPPDVDNRLLAELSADERLVWIGQPRPSHWAWGATPYVCVGLLWNVVPVAGLVWLGVLTVQGQTTPMQFFLTVSVFSGFLLVGLGFMSTPLFERCKAQRTCYAITDRRVLTLTGIADGYELRARDRAEVSVLERWFHFDNTADLIFERHTAIERDADGLRRKDTKWGFFGIDDAHAVSQLLRGPATDSLPSATAAPAAVVEPVARAVDMVYEGRRRVQRGVSVY